MCVCHASMCACACLCSSLCVCICLFHASCVFACLCACMHACVRVCACVHARVCAHACMCVSVCKSYVHVAAPQLCWMWAGACLWVEGVCRECTTPFSCTSTGAAPPATDPNTLWTDTDTPWRYGTHHNTPTGETPSSYETQWLTSSLVWLSRCILSTWSPPTPTCRWPWETLPAWRFSECSLTWAEMR